MQYNDIFKHLRNQKNWSQSYLANKLDISVGTYSSYERGNSEPALAVLIKMSELFEVSLDYLATGKEYELPLTDEEDSQIQTDRVALRIENRIERQTQLLSHIGKKFENNLSSIVREYSNNYVEKFSRSAGTVLLEEEVWSIELHSKKTRVAYPYAIDNIVYDPKTKLYSPGDYFHVLKRNLRQNPDHEYSEIFSNDVELSLLKEYKQQISNKCGNAALKRITLMQSNQPVITQYAIFDLKLKELRDDNPTIFEMVVDHVFMESYLGLLVGPQIKFGDINLLADRNHCEFMINHYEHLIQNSKII